MKKWIAIIAITLVGCTSLFWITADKDMRKLVLNLPTNTDVLFWSTAQRDAAFRALDRLPILIKSRTIAAGDNVLPLPTGKPFQSNINIDQYMAHQRTSALLIIQDGKVRLEKYSMDFGPNGRWTSFSVAKSLTSTLVGAAIKDGYIKSLDDIVSDYIPDLRGSAYDNVTIKQLLTMTSGVKWNEDYADPNSDVAQFNNHQPDAGIDATVSYMRRLQPEAEPGSKWVYKTGETNLIGVLVTSATNKTLSDYLSEKIWSVYGMQQDASWLLSATGQEISGCCIQAATRDMARFGLFMLDGGKIHGESILPEYWIDQATSEHTKTDSSQYGYGYQWWSLENGAYSARGIFGQGIFIDPKRKLVIASNSNWPQASDGQGATHGAERLNFYREVQRALDAETQP